MRALVFGFLFNLGVMFGALVVGHVLGRIAARLVIEARARRWQRRGALLRCVRCSYARLGPGGDTHTVYCPREGCEGWALRRWP